MPAVNGGTTAISAGTALVENPVFAGDVPGAWLSLSGNLFVAGTPANDTILINPITVKVNGVKTPSIQVKMNRTTVGTFAADAVSGSDHGSWPGWQRCDSRKCPDRCRCRFVWWSGQ